VDSTGQQASTTNEVVNDELVADNDPFGETSTKVELTMRWAIRCMRWAGAFSTEDARRLAYFSCALPFGEHAHHDDTDQLLAHQYSGQDSRAGE
jgi:hypothetical protein